jgi:hypothetical protein
MPTALDTRQLLAKIRSDLAELGLTLDDAPGSVADLDFRRALKSAVRVKSGIVSLVPNIERFDEDMSRARAKTPRQMALDSIAKSLTQWAKDPELIAAAVIALVEGEFDTTASRKSEEVSDAKLPRVSVPNSGSNPTEKSGGTPQAERAKSALKAQARPATKKAKPMDPILADKVARTGQTPASGGEKAASESPDLTSSRGPNSADIPHRNAGKGTDAT